MHREVVETVIGYNLVGRRDKGPESLGGLI